MKLITLAFIAISILGFYAPNPMGVKVHSTILPIESGKPGVYQIWYSRKGVCGEYLPGEDIPKCLAAIR